MLAIRRRGGADITQRQYCPFSPMETKRHRTDGTKLGTLMEDCALIVLDCCCIREFVALSCVSRHWQSVANKAHNDPRLPGLAKAIQEEVHRVAVRYPYSMETLEAYLWAPLRRTMARNSYRRIIDGIRNDYPDLVHIEVSSFKCKIPGTLFTFTLFCKTTGEHIKFHASRTKKGRNFRFEITMDTSWTQTVFLLIDSEFNDGKYHQYMFAEAFRHLIPCFSTNRYELDYPFSTEALFEYILNLATLGKFGTMQDDLQYRFDADINNIPSQVYMSPQDAEAWLDSSIRTKPIPWPRKYGHQPRQTHPYVSDTRSYDMSMRSGSFPKRGDMEQCITPGYEDEDEF
jgi:hypothetical protein